jgi:hypothetical protein
MAIKFTDLPQLSGSPAADDIVAIVDVSEDVSKKLTISDLVSIAVDEVGIDSATAISVITGSDLDMGGNKVLFGNVYTSESDLPSASAYHGMFAHVHSTGAAYFAHAGAWVKLSNFSDNPVFGGTVTAKNFIEDVDSVSGTSISVDPTNGSLVTHTLSGTTTYTYAAGWSEGESLTLHIVSNGNTVNWPTTKWVGGEAPDLSSTTGVHLVNLWKIGSNVYGAYIGEAS